MLIDYTVEKIEKQLEELRQASDRQVFDIPAFKQFVGDGPGLERPDWDDSDWLDFQVGDTWGGYDVTTWFRARVAVPQGWEGHKLVLRFLTGPRDGGGSTAEALLFVNGKPLQGIDVWHTQAWLPPEEIQDGQVSVALRAWSGVIAPPKRRTFKLAQLVWVETACEEFVSLGTALLKAACALPEGDLRRIRLLQDLNSAFGRIDFFKPGTDRFYESVAQAGQSLNGCLQQYADWKELKPRVVGIGHAHIDMAWLWRLKDTRQKAARTFSTALHLMRQYPEYRFLHSSPQLYRYLKSDYPSIYAQVKEKIREGAWEITGGMWVEADTNLISGESLVRQFLLGRRFVQEEFGQEMKILWLPDVFGYSAALPQIARKSGIEAFLTTKISWNQTNRFPYDTFQWRGLDGTELLTHFVTTPDGGSHIYTYNGQLEPGEVRGLWDNYRQKELNDELLTLYGWGDGGGGPTEEMIRSAGWMKHLPGIPEVSLGKAEPYFERLKERLSGRELPVWDGELYLEYHRGTYTSQAANKRANRKAEFLYHQAEWAAALADLLEGEDQYPADALRTGWELILLNQFHDILPGSSIQAVYDDSREDYARIEAIGQGVLEASLGRIGQHFPAAQAGLLVFNGLSQRRAGLVEAPWSAAWEAEARWAGQDAAVQRIETETGPRALVQVEAVPGYGFRFQAAQSEALAQVAQSTQVPALAGGIGEPTWLGLVQAEPSDPWAGMMGEGLRWEHRSALVIQPDRLENEYYVIRLNGRGQILSLWDRQQGREVLAAGQVGNRLLVFEDKPLNFDAWDIDAYYQEKSQEIGELVAAEVEECGPLRGVLRLEWVYGDSHITQRLTLYRRSPRIDFRTEVDWHEHQTLLKVAFPVAIRATRASYDIAFGHIERPTHWNTSWDAARFEVPAHRWADLSEGNYGVALLNDCKYGYDIKGNTLRLTLIKSAIHPDPMADQGRHEFTYSLLPHAGDLVHGGVIEEANDLNLPLLALPLEAAAQGGEIPDFCLAETDQAGVLIDTIKQAEDGNGWIVRVVEAHQCHQSAVRLRFGLPLKGAQACNLMEAAEGSAEYHRRELVFDLAPFEIKTFRVWF